MIRRRPLNAPRRAPRTYRRIPITARSTIGEVYAHPLGRDIVDTILHRLAKPNTLVTNPLVSRLRLGTLEKLAKPWLGEGVVDTIARLLNSETGTPTTATGPATPAWWKEAVFYQVYPRSFQDSNGDGVGDLKGITSRLDYLQQLGVDCVWLSPVFDSPNEDMGYDVRDYRAVMEEMGTMADLDELIASCHERGMRIILDLVVNHTSLEHEWFQQAVADPDGPYGDYYILREGSPTEPPNNWTSFFSGSAWRWIPAAKRWALHLFAAGQMDLNWENPRVRTEVADVVQFWLDRGVDGFRMDVINYISKTPGLPDGSRFVGELMTFWGVEHYFWGPRLHEYLHEVRERGFTRKPGSVPASTARERHPDGTLGEPLPPDPVGVLVGETPGVGIEMARLLTGEDRQEMDLTFVFEILDAPGKARGDAYRYPLQYMTDYLKKYQQRIGSGDWIALFCENHDNARMVSKVEPELTHRAAVAKAIATIMLTHRGTPFLYQGQELGAANQAFPGPEALRDVEAINLLAEDAAAGTPFEETWARLMAGTRDHSRVPVRWDSSPNGGFTDGEPWIAGYEDDPCFTAEAQEADPDSVLNWYRSLIALRRAHPAFVYGEIEFADDGADGYAAWFRTSEDGERWLVELNLTEEPIDRPHPDLAAELVLGRAAGRDSRMEPYEAAIWRVRG